jgi:hypothetical protein
MFMLNNILMNAEMLKTYLISNLVNNDSTQKNNILSKKKVLSCLLLVLLYFASKKLPTPSPVTSPAFLSLAK